MRVLIIVFCLLFSSCATFYNINDKGLAKYNKPLNIESNFSINGRFFVQIKNNSYYGNFEWSHDNIVDNIDFKSPLGQVFAKLDINRINKTTLLIFNQQKYTGNDVAVIMQNSIGFYLPFDYLCYWILAVPVPDYKVDSYFYNGFSQLDFDIYFISWYDVNHPKYIKLENKSILIKLFLNWS